VEVAGKLLGPLDGGVGVLDGRREGVFGREPVVHREHQRLAGVGQVPTDVVVGVRAIVNEAAAVKEDRDGGVARLGVVGANREGTVGPLGLEVVDRLDTGRVDPVGHVRGDPR